jgi:phytoene desaturase
VGKKVIIIGSGFAGMSAASFMAKAGWEVTVLEKQSLPGGRARKMEIDGFLFDMGPSWYWMPDVFERYFAQFGKKVSDYYQLKRLDPSYRVYWEDGYSDIPSDLQELKKFFHSLEPGSDVKLQQFLDEAAYKYRVGVQKLVFKPGQSVMELIDWEVMKGVFKLDVFNNMKSHVAKFFKHPKLRQLVEFPVLFLGALPEHTPALYSLMNYADMVGGTWFPDGGMYQIVAGMHRLAAELGVQFVFNQNVNQIITENKSAKSVRAIDTVTGVETIYEADVVIGGADYHFIEQSLLPAELRTYSKAYWDSRAMAPSCLLYYIGLNKKIPNVLHHSLFFDVPFDEHSDAIYTNPDWPKHPLFYMSVTSVTDAGTAPAGGENLFLLIPVAAGLEGDDEVLRERYFNMIMDRLEARVGMSIRDSIVVKKSFAHRDFKEVYNAFKGNAYGLANTLMQTANLKPACRSKKVRNLFYTGQLTVPGPGVPPSLISGEVVAGEVVKHFG